MIRGTDESYGAVKDAELALLGSEIRFHQGTVIPAAMHDSEKMDHDEIIRRYGPWCPRTVADVVELFSGYSGRWWIAGGWAIEAFTDTPREHGDIDPSIPRGDVSLLREHLLGRFDVWAADQGTLRPLVGEDATVPPSCGNLWVRRSGAEPWEYDILLMDISDDRWTYKRDPRISLPLAEILWVRDGVSYLRPQVQLLHKAAGLRPQDQQDFDASLPLLEESARRWLRTSINTAHPGHPWVSRSDRH